MREKENRQPGRSQEQQIAHYNRELSVKCTKCMEVLQEFEQAAEHGRREHLRSTMDTLVREIGAAVKELGQSGIGTTAAQVEKDYRIYVSNPRAEAYSAFQNDLQTLKDFTRLRENIQSPPRHNPRA